MENSKSEELISGLVTAFIDLKWSTVYSSV